MVRRPICLKMPSLASNNLQTLTNDFEEMQRLFLATAIESTNLSDTERRRLIFEVREEIENEHKSSQRISA